MILDIGEQLSKYWNIYWILVAPKISVLGVTGGVKPKISLVTAKSGDNCP